jgi:hypothetical protein
MIEWRRNEKKKKHRLLYIILFYITTILLRRETGLLTPHEVVFVQSLSAVDGSYSIRYQAVCTEGGG